MDVLGFSGTFWHDSSCNEEDRSKNEAGKERRSCVGCAKRLLCHHKNGPAAIQRTNPGPINVGEVLYLALLL